MRNKLQTIILVQVFVILGVLFFYAPTSTATAQSDYIVKVSKTTEGDFTVTDGTTYIGTYFDTTYSITGTSTDFIRAKDALMTSIIDDFSKSPTIGYIKMNTTDIHTNNNMTGLANPFVNKEQIDVKIKSVLSYALDKIEHPVGITPDIGNSREIKCSFGNVLSNFWCDIPTFVMR